MFLFISETCMFDDGWTDTDTTTLLLLPPPILCFFCLGIIQEYIKSLIEVLNMAEDLESLENLHALCSLMQTICMFPFSCRLTTTATKMTDISIAIVMLNDHTLYDHILEDELFYGVVGMLECASPFLSLKNLYNNHPSFSAFEPF